MVPEAGYRFENLVASQLFKYCHWLEDTQGHTMELRYLRDTDKREVDFVVIKNKKAAFAVECKTGERSISPAVSYFAQRTLIPQFYQVHLGGSEYTTGKVSVLPFWKFCIQLDMP